MGKRGTSNMDRLPTRRGTMDPRKEFDISKGIQATNAIGWGRQRNQPSNAINECFSSVACMRNLGSNFVRGEYLL